MGRYFGLLHVRVIEGSNVHHSYTSFRRRRTHASCYRQAVCGADVRKCGGADPCGGRPDPYVVVAVECEKDRTYRLGRSKTVTATLSPVWNDEFTTLIDLSDSAKDCVFSQPSMVDWRGPHLVISIFDDDMAGPYNDDLLCSVAVPFGTVAKPGKAVIANLNLRHPQAKPNSHSMAALRMEFKWISLVPQKIGAVPGSRGPTSAVPNSYFKRSHGNLVTLYHDAHCMEGDFPKIPLPGYSQDYEAANCWQDIYNSIMEAEHFCLLAGWSINTKTRLKRVFTEEETQSETLGELLFMKAQQGVDVTILIWDDFTSIDGPEFMKSGIMVTYDEYTRAYYVGTPVKVILAKRCAADDVGTMLYPIVGALKSTSFTHHQKMVICDATSPLSEDGRKILCAYVGGLDLTSGRYDTNRHELFTTLKTAHLDDFYNGCILDACCESGPREPWHDIHTRVLGPAAWDVLQTFMERLLKQAPARHALISALLESLISSNRLRSGEFVLIHPSDPRAWDVQVFRSLDTESAVFLNKKWVQLYTQQNCMVDRTVHQAYLYLIDKAKRYIYVENQYFLGSAQYWTDLFTTPAWHLVPFEIVRRICLAIQNGERFCAYILTPLYPEGSPTSTTVQEILHWQYQTRKMMYQKIGAKLQSVGDTTSHPTDYLQFFFVGKREPTASLPKSPAKLSAELERSVNARRLQIYVHSKLMIVDDEYLICGSANINERSMAGCRDTEIAVGCSQPAHVVRETPEGDLILPKGDVAAFRLQLWQEHLGNLIDEFADPASLPCVRVVKEIAEANWQAYSSDEPMALPRGYMCTYPLHCRKDGTLEALPTCPNIPGTDASIVGYPSVYLPSALTT